MCGVINISDIKIGDVYGDNTIVGEVKDERKDGRRVWLCKCKCGNIKKKSTKYAKQGRTCGYCGLYLDEDSKPHNKYDLSGEYGIGRTSKGEEFYFDLEDYKLIYPYCWYKMSNGYICYKDNKENILLHRLVMKCPNNMTVDHINHNKVDNRKNNLRVCNYTNNLYNTRTQINSSTGLKYIKFNKQCNKYQILYKSEHCGLYQNIHTAYIKLKEITKQDDSEFIYENNLYKNDIRKKLFIDMDGVIFNTIKTIVNIYNYDYKYYEDFIEVDSNEVNTWDFKECNCATKEAIDLYFNQPRFFNNLILMDNAIETINRLEKKFCIILVSMGSEENLLLKQIWVNKNIPGVKFIGVSFKEHLDKSHIDMSDGIFIDDSVKNLETSNAIENICFGDLYEWNKCWNGKRCFNWTELEKYIEEVYENHKL